MKQASVVGSSVGVSVWVAVGDGSRVGGNVAVDVAVAVGGTAVAVELGRAVGVSVFSTIKTGSFSASASSSIVICGVSLGEIVSSGAPSCGSAVVSGVGVVLLWRLARARKNIIAKISSNKRTAAGMRNLPKLAWRTWSSSFAHAGGGGGGGADSAAMARSIASI